MTGVSVTVVLSTYNGGRFLLEQLDSLAAQSHPPDTLVLRDDGSTDHSIEIVRKWACQQKIFLHEIVGARLGPARSFLTALQGAKPADIFLFCDQDDVWLPRKIERALRMLNRGKGAAPALYASRLAVVDESLEFLRLSPLPREISFASATCENIMTGCTLAFNSAFRELLGRSLPRDLAMHDWWCYLVATSIEGIDIYYDDEAAIYYRQHGANALGAGPTGWAAFQKRLVNFFGANRPIRSRQLQDFGCIYGSLLNEQAAFLLRTLIDAKKGRRERFRAALLAPVRRQTIMSTLATRLAILIGKF